MAGAGKDPAVPRVAEVWLLTAQPGDPGRYLDADAAAAPLDDRGLRYGDGLFETMRVASGVLPFGDLHLTRLRDGMARLGFPPLPATDEAIVAACAELARRAGVVEGFIRLTLSRGSAERGFAPPAEARWRLWAEAGPLPPAGPLPGVSCVLAPWRLDPRYPGSRVKSLSALDKVLALQLAREAGAHEAILWNTRGELVEATQANLFIVVGDEILTPGLASGPLPGIARQVVLRAAAEQGMAVREAPVSRRMARGASEMFLTNALRGVVPVASCDGHAYAQVPGACTGTIRDLYERTLAARAAALLGRG